MRRINRTYGVDLCHVVTNLFFQAIGTVIDEKGGAGGITEGNRLDVVTDRSKVGTAPAPTDVSGGRIEIVGLGVDVKKVVGTEGDKDVRHFFFFCVLSKIYAA